jgi:redox-sensitive bicupin YhaK (pirin superfamily)
VIEVSASHAADVAGMPVRRALPRAGRRTVGAWCFVDHMGPVTTTAGAGLDVSPHPHIGLQTVTWLFEGEALHRDSLGTEQPIRPGQLNLMTAGRGIVHSEEGLGRNGGTVHGVQLWVAQPERTRHGDAAFEHRAELPRFDSATISGTVLVGEFAGVSSPARRDTDHVGVDLRLRAGRGVVELDPSFEYALVMFDGAVGVADHEAQMTPGHLAFLGAGRAELALDAPGDAHGLLLGGLPFESAISMWWNFVARSHAELEDANRDWRSGSDRFVDPASPFPRVSSPDTPWSSPPR